MKKIIIGVILFGFSFLGLYIFTNFNSKNSSVISPEPKPTDVIIKSIISSTVAKPKIQKSIFIPYWALNNNKKLEIYDYQKIIYFGVAASEGGIDKEDPGYKKLKTFSDLSGNSSEKYLTIRMVNSSLNSKVLKNKNLQSKIIKQSIEIAKENFFKGLVLDFEIAALSFESVIKDINDFYKNYYNLSKKENLEFLFTIYGDTFYRGRPYDVRYLAGNSDGVLIMAYDFHKSKGNPGPNFPYTGKGKYGYDFKTMIKDFSKKVPTEKITVILGMFGYDWMIDDKNQPLGIANSLSTNEIKNSFMNDCRFKNCFGFKDKESFETEINYVDFNNNKHIIWFEDENSAKQKADYIRQKGIDSVGFWAYSYF